MNIGIAHIVSARWNGTFYEVKVTCPLCSKTHSHTWMPDGGVIRASHCGNGYYQVRMFEEAL